MREIKFRGRSMIDHTPDDMPYCIFKGDMVTGLLAKAGENAWIIGNVVEESEEYIAIESWIPVDPETVGEYTGMKDKYREEIFEGDIVITKGDEERYLVCFNEARFCLVGNRVTYGLGEFCERDLEAAAAEQQEEHRESSAREALIRDFLEKQVPRDWAKWTLEQRRVFWGGGSHEAGELISRDRVCALEVWIELFGGDARGMKYADAAEINACIAAIPEWKRSKVGLRHGYCGYQRGFENDRNKPGLWTETSETFK